MMKLFALMLSLGSAASSILPLLEASGAASGSVVVAGKFAASSFGAVLQSRGAELPPAVLLLDGPTPHVVGNHTDMLPAGVPIAATSAIDLIPNTAAICAIQWTAKGEILSVAVPSRKSPKPLAVNGAISVTSLGSNNVVALATGPKTAPFLFVSAHATSGELYVVSATDLGVKAKPGYVWRAIGAAADGQLAAVRSSPGNMILDVILFSNCSAAGSCSGSFPYTRTLNSSSSAPIIIGASIADVYADGAPHLLLTYADSTMDVLWLTDGADPLYRAASFRLDPSPSAVWASVALGPWLGTDPSALPHESQVMGLRHAPPPPPTTPPTPQTTSSATAPPTFHTDLLLFGRPEHWLRRRASVSNVRAMQEFKTSYRDNGTNVAGLTAPLDVEAFKQVLTSVHANTYSYSVCDCGAYSTTAWNCSPLYGYEQLVRFLEATKDFKIDGQQLRVW